MYNLERDVKIHELKMASPSYRYLCTLLDKEEIAIEDLIVLCEELSVDAKIMYPHNTELLWRNTLQWLDGNAKVLEPHIRRHLDKIDHNAMKTTMERLFKESDEYKYLSKIMHKEDLTLEEVQAINDELYGMAKIEDPATLEHSWLRQGVWFAHNFDKLKPLIDKLVNK